MSAVAAEYSHEPHVSADFTYGGVLIAWDNLSEEDLERIVPRIQAHAKNLASTYKVSLSDREIKHISLGLDHKRPPDRADLLRIKGDVFTVLIDTSWGGSG